MEKKYILLKFRGNIGKKEHINKDFNNAYCELDCWIYLLKLPEDPVELLFKERKLPNTLCKNVLTLSSL